jgi:DNA end-binding protein Ku
MPRAIWSGSISFGLVNIPVKLYSAISEKNVRFNQLDRRNGARVKQHRVNAETGEEVGWEDIVKGYEVSKGNYVLVSEDELMAFAPEANHQIDLECFVDLDEIDPIFFDGAYHVAPAQAAKPYALLVRAMEEANKVAIARFVMRSKQYLAALRPKDGTLLLSMMVYADEINPTQEIGEFDDVASVSVDQRELAMAGQLIESLSEPFEPESYHDTYREQVLELIERKAGGEQIVAETTPAPSADKVIDLMAALEASVQAAKGARGRHPTALASVSDIDGADADADADEGQGEEETAARAGKRTARKAPAKKSAAKEAPAKKSSAKKAPAKKVAAARKTA